MLEGLLSPMHLIVILAIALIVLGPKRLPDAGRGMGEAFRGFKESVAGRHDELGATNADTGPAHGPLTQARADQTPAEENVPAAV